MKLIPCDYPIPTPIIDAEQLISKCSKLRTYGELLDTASKALELLADFPDDGECEQNRLFLAPIQASAKAHSRSDEILEEYKSSLAQQITDNFFLHTAHSFVIQTLNAQYQTKLKNFQQAFAAMLSDFKLALAAKRQQTMATQIDALQYALEELLILARKINKQIQTALIITDKNYLQKMEQLQNYYADIAGLIPTCFCWKYLVKTQAPHQLFDLIATHLACHALHKKTTIAKIDILRQLLAYHLELQRTKYYWEQLRHHVQTAAHSRIITGIDSCLFLLSTSAGVLSFTTYTIISHLLKTGINALMPYLCKITPPAESDLGTIALMDTLSQLTPDSAIAYLNRTNNNLRQEIKSLQVGSGFYNIAPTIFNSLFNSLFPFTMHSSLLGTLGYFGGKFAVTAIAEPKVSAWFKSEVIPNIVQPDSVKM